MEHAAVQGGGRMKIHTGSMGFDPRAVKRPCAMGIDQRPTSWDVSVFDLQRSPAGLYIPRLVFYGKTDADPDTVLALELAYGVVATVMDAAPERNLAIKTQEISQKKGIRNFWRADYLTTPGIIKIQENTIEDTLRLERTLTLDEVMYSFMHGLVALPVNFEFICGQKFQDELLTSSTTEEMHAGKLWTKWVSKGDDHAFHSIGYAFIAIELGRLLTQGSDVTMGASDGIVHSSLRKNVMYDPNVANDELLDAEDLDAITWVA
jgi:hypothetical protein